MKRCRLILLVLCALAATTCASPDGDPQAASSPAPKPFVAAAVGGGVQTVQRAGGGQPSVTTASPATTGPSATTTTRRAATTTRPVAATTTIAPPRPFDPATTRYVSAPGTVATGGDGTAASPWSDFCAALGRLSNGWMLVVAGDHDHPYDFDTMPSTASTSTCSINPSVTDIWIWGQGDPLLKGVFIVADAYRWTFDNIDVTRSAAMGHDKMVSMVGGNGWRWTNCEIYGSAAFADFSVGIWTGTSPPIGWRLDHCFIHDNPGWATHSTNQNDNIYIFTQNGVASQGVIADNYFVGAPLGFNVKIGGTALRPDEGSDGVTLQRNTMVNNRVDGSNLLISTNSDHVHVSQNVLAAQGQGEPVMNVGLGYFDGADLQFNSNIVWGYDPALYGGARPILWHDYYGSFDSIDLNEPSVHLTQSGNVHLDPGYPALAASNPDRSRFPAVMTGGSTYGASW